MVGTQIQDAPLHEKQKRRELLRRLNLPFCAGYAEKFLGSIFNFTASDIEQLEYALLTIREEPDH